MRRADKLENLNAAENADSEGVDVDTETGCEDASQVESDERYDW